MRNRDEELGYMKGQIESLEEQVRELDAKQKLLLEKIEDNTQQLALYRHLFVFIRTALWIGVAIMTFKFGDIPDIWRGDK